MKISPDLDTAGMPPSDAPKKKTRHPTVRMPHAERRAQILQQAFDFFSEHGLTAQTRALADACGVSQRLLYSMFPNKATLIAEVYETEIAGPFKALWFVLLTDRSKPVEQRLIAFYHDYYHSILTSRWLRLFLHASLSNQNMARTYISKIVKQLLDIIVEEATLEAGLAMPEDPALRHELAWCLHGAISHLAIRRHIYADPSPLDPKEVITLQVRMFLAALPVAVPARSGA